MAWYFNSEGFIKAKSRSRLTVPEIQQEFLKKVSPSGIVAVFMTSEMQKDHTPVIFFEYLDKQKFSSLPIT